MNNLTRKPIVDKNGKATTVHVKTDTTDAATSRVSGVPANPPVVPEWTPPEVATLAQMKEKARALHPDAEVHLDGRRWVITLPTDIEEDRTLPDYLKDTPAWEAANTYDPSIGGSELDRWQDHNRSGGSTIEEVALNYNIAVTAHHYNKMWFDEQAEKRGLRSFDEIIAEGNPDATEDEKQLIREWSEYRTNSSSAVSQYTREKQADMYNRLEEIWQS